MMLYSHFWLVAGHFLMCSTVQFPAPRRKHSVFHHINDISRFALYRRFRTFRFRTFVKSSLAKMERGDPVSMMIALSLLPRFRPSIMNGCTAALPSAALSNHRLAPSKLPICSAFLIVHFVDSAFSASSASFLPGISGWTFPGVP